MKKLILKNKYLFLLTLFLLTVSMSVFASFTIAKYTKTVDVGTIRLEFTEKEAQEESSVSSDSFDGTYTVQKGDTLSEIAKKYSTTVEKLQAYNDIEGTLITESQKINIPPQDYVIPEPEPTESQETTPAETEPAEAETTNTDSSNTPVTDAPALPEEPTDESVSVITDDPTISEEV